MEHYQDYVIKDGKFVGKFEQMYQKFDDPWHQKEEVFHSHSRWDTILSLKQHHISSFLEVGCGLGAFFHFIVQHIPEIEQKGIDISATAINKARTRYPELNFEVCSVLDYFRNKIDEGKINAVILSEIVWYILDDLEQIIMALKKNWSGILIINQTFYKGQQKYGKEYFTSVDGLIRWLDLPLIYKAEYNTSESGSIETQTIYQI